jgi:glycosyltransferase involved in cell wall biosynthesis
VNYLRTIRSPTQDSGPAPHVSVVIPAYQAESFLAGALNSATEQSFSDLEIIVVDDASSDRTSEVVRDAARSDERIRLHRLNQNSGPGAARNRALDLARGEWICLLDADDRMEPTRIEWLLGLARAADADMVSDNLLLCPQDGAAPRPMIPVDAFGPVRRIGFAEFVDGNIFYKGVPARVSLGFMQPLISRAFLDRNAIRYPAEVRSGEDFIFYLDCFARGASWWVTPQPWYRYTVRDGSLTDQQSNADKGAIIRHEEQAIARALGLRDAELVRILKRHKRDLDRPYLYRRFTDALKARCYGEAAGLLARGPGAAQLILEQALREAPTIAAKAMRGGYGRRAAVAGEAAPD